MIQPGHNFFIRFTEILSQQFFKWFRNMLFKKYILYKYALKLLNIYHLGNFNFDFNLLIIVLNEYWKNYDRMYQIQSVFLTVHCVSMILISLLISMLPCCCASNHLWTLCWNDDKDCFYPKWLGALANQNLNLYKHMLTSQWISRLSGSQECKTIGSCHLQSLPRTTMNPWQEYM